MSKKILEVIKKYWTSIIILLLGINLIVRLVDSARLVFTFPFDLTNDISAYMAQLHFLKVCGFLQWCPYWYNGFINLQISPPGWYFFAYPLYLISGNVTTTTYLSMILLYIFGFFAFMYLGKLMKWGVLKRIAFFLLFFANVSAIGNFIRNGRQHAMLSIVLFVLLFCIIWQYKDKKIKLTYFLSSIIYSLMLVTHYQETVLASLLFVCLFVYKKTVQQRILVAMSFFLSFILALWWLIPFLKGIKNSDLINLHEGLRIFEFSKEVIFTNILTVLIPLLFLLIVYVYSKKDLGVKKDLIFFMPLVAFAGLYLLRLTAFIPILRNISQDPYLFFFIFFILFLFFKEERYYIDHPLLGSFFLFGILLVTLISIFLSLTYTPFFVPNNDLDEEVKDLFFYVDGKFYLLGPFKLEDKLSYSKPYLAYGAIYHNLSTADGWSTPLTNRGYLTRFTEIRNYFLKDDCMTFKNELAFYNVTNIIAHTSNCEKLQSCGLVEVKSLKNVCLYRIK